jgi:SAM-dependent methyltransferase
MNCRHCRAPLQLSMADLGSAPPSNAYLTEAALHGPEISYPLRVLVCERCWLAQTEDFARAQDLFDAQYAYFSGYSSTWQQHAERFAAAMVARFDLTTSSRVVEVATNDGTVLQQFARLGIACLGVEPTASTAAAARAKGLEVVEEFFGVQLARALADRGVRADLTVANNVLAHVPEVNDFVAGFAALLAPHGVATFEFPHLERLIEGNQFDTIYHEHFSYLSLTAARAILAANGLAVFDVEELSTHGGSLRVFAQRADTGARAVDPRVDALLRREAAAGLLSADAYRSFQRRAERTKDDLLRFLVDAKRDGQRVAAYGAAAKGNTFLNYAGVRRDLVAFVADRNPAKQGRFLPGSRIPVVDEAHLRAERPDFVLILPWNIRAEIQEQLDYVRAWGGRFVVAVPRLEVR